jgi:hypothetical protein
VAIFLVKNTIIVLNWIKKFIYLLKSKISLNFVIFVAAKKKDNKFFPPPLLLPFLDPISDRDPGSGIWDLGWIKVRIQDLRKTSRIATLLAM